MIYLRPVQAADADNLFPLIYHSPVTDMLMWDGPESPADYREKLAERQAAAQRGEYDFFSIIETGSNLPIGTCSLRPEMHGLSAEIGLWLGMPYQGKGYGQRVVKELVESGFLQRNHDKINAEVVVGNWPGLRIFQKNGFSLEGTLRKACWKRGYLRDIWAVGITRDEFLRQTDLIVHICRREEWRAAQKAGCYRPADLDLSGFIHCSRAEQVQGVVRRYFRSVDDLLLVWIRPGRLRAELRWESADGQLFPHIYGVLNLDAVAAVRPVMSGGAGALRV